MTKTIIITGSTRGIGRGLAEELLARGHRVVISGRSQASVEAALEELTEAFPAEHILGQPCDVSDYKQVQTLWDAAVDHFGYIDIWVNNAGLNHDWTAFRNLDPQTMRAVVEANLLGGMYGARVAIHGMQTQGGGHFYIMEGSGSNGRVREGVTAYGTTKRGLNYLFDALVMEQEGTSVKVSAISPGMVLTDMLSPDKMTRPEDWERVKGVFDILADRVEDVTPWLAESILQNDKHGASLRRLNAFKIMWRFATARFRKHNPTAVYE